LCRISRTSLLAIIRIGLVARICRSHSSKEDQYRQGRGSIPRFGILLFETRECRGCCFVKNRMGEKSVDRFLTIFFFWRRNSISRSTRAVAEGPVFAVHADCKPALLNSPIKSLSVRHRYYYYLCYRSHELILTIGGRPCTPMRRDAHTKVSSVFGGSMLDLHTPSIFMSFDGVAINASPESLSMSLLKRNYLIDCRLCSTKPAIAQCAVTTSY
jgi:hypothetical protein